MSAPRKFSLLRLFRHSASGAVAVEFVFIFPLLVALLVASNETARFIRARQQLNDYAAMVAYDIAGLSSNVPAERLNEMIRRFGLVAPELIDATKDDAWSTSGTPYFRVGISMVEMQKDTNSCASNKVLSSDGCKYKAWVRWTFGSYKRPCQELTTRNVGSDVRATLPADAFQRNAVVMVDVQAAYKPIFQSGFKVGEFDLGALNSSLTQTFTTESWQPVRNWRNAGQSITASTAYPLLSGNSAGGWDGTCP